MKEVRLEGLSEHLVKPQRIVVTNHVNPDGDAMGSALGLALALKKLGHEVVVVVPNNYPEFLKWLPGTADVIIADAAMEKAVEAIEKSTLIFHLDYNAMNRAAQLAEKFEKANAIKVLIDHHRQPESWPDYIFSDTEMSSTSQMIYEWLQMNNWLHVLDAEIANCLYTGIVTDTGSFRFAVTTDRTHQIAAHLLELGVKPNLVYDRVFDSNSLGRLRLLGCMLDKLEYFQDKKAVLLHLGKSDLMKNNYQKGDSEGFVNYGLSIGGTALSIFLREDKDLVKVSLRSKGTLDVNELARAYFNGGGHMNAAGGSLPMPMAEALAFSRKIINQQVEETAK